jgi:catechol 2,3-dioxygenase-like lactoylglutathione lyase family enzyme
MDVAVELLAPDDIRRESLLGASFANFGSIPLIKDPVRDLLEDASVVPTLPVSSMQRARRFYEDKVGLTRIEAEAEGTIRYGCGGGTGLALFERPTEPLDRTAAAWEVDDIEKEVEELRSRGVIIDGVITLPSGVKRAFFRDPDGNVLGIRQL